MPSSPESSRIDAHAAQRRHLMLALLAGAGLACRSSRAADLLAQLSNQDAGAGLRAALERGAGAAVDALGKTDGFWANERLRIPLPDWLQKGESVIRMLGRGKDLDDLHLGMNRAAEQAVPAARQLLVDAVRSMSIKDAKAILSGGDDSATRYFEAKTRAPIGTRFLPIVTGVTQRIGLARNYDRLVDRVAALGVAKSDDARIEPHVTTKALDGLFAMIGDEEHKIRADPVATGSAILKKVFGAL